MLEVVKAASGLVALAIGLEKHAAAVDIQP